MVPRLLSGLETHLSSDHTVHTQRHRARRSLNSPGGGHVDPDNIILSVPAFGRSLYLNLTRSRKFLSGDFVVEERRGNQSAALSHLSTKQLCFYSGSVVNHTGSLASVSTCGGLVNPSFFFFFLFFGFVFMFHVIQSKQLSSRPVHLLHSKGRLDFSSLAWRDLTAATRSMSLSSCQVRHCR